MIIHCINELNLRESDITSNTFDTKTNKHEFVKGSPFLELGILKDFVISSGTLKTYILDWLVPLISPEILIILQFSVTTAKSFVNYENESAEHLFSPTMALTTFKATLLSILLDPKRISYGLGCRI